MEKDKIILISIVLGAIVLIVASFFLTGVGASVSGGGSIFDDKPPTYRAVCSGSADSDGTNFFNPTNEKYSLSKVSCEAQKCGLFTQSIGDIWDDLIFRAVRIDMIVDGVAVDSKAKELGVWDTGFKFTLQSTCSEKVPDRIVLNLYDNERVELEDTFETRVQ